MSTLAELRADLRVMLSDTTAGAYLWSDAQLNGYLAAAIRGYSRHFPREMGVSITTVAGQQEYDLPSDCDRVVSVQVVEELQTLVEGGDCYDTGYYIYGGKVGLLPAPATGGKTLDVHYLAPHTALSSDTDASSIPASDEDMLLAMAATRAIESLATDEAKRRQFESATGGRATAATTRYEAEWERSVRVKGQRVRSGRLVSR